MNLFQAVFLPLFIVTALAALARCIRSRGRDRLRAGAASLAALMASVVVASPSLSTAVSRQFGIGRGADFVVYLGLIVIGYGCAALYRRQRRLEEQLTTLVRAQALRDAAIREDGNNEDTG